jgi:hypothetical protein
LASHLRLKHASSTEPAFMLEELQESLYLI